MSVTDEIMITNEKPKTSIALHEKAVRILSHCFANFLFYDLVGLLILFLWLILSEAGWEMFRRRPCQLTSQKAIADSVNS
jgi:hypothetical protein